MAMTQEQQIAYGIRTNENLIALNIILVVYLHCKRYDEAMKEIEELLNDPEMQIYREHLLLKQSQVRQEIADAEAKAKRGFLQSVFDFFHDPA
jgi:hypothetical protein